MERCPPTFSLVGTARIIHSSAMLVGSSEKIRRTLGWKPGKAFTDLVREMVEAELAALSVAAR